MDRDNDEIRLLIMQWTAQRYEDAKDTEKDHTERLRLLLDEHNLDRYDDELTAKIVSSILLNEPCTVTVRYINGMEITMGKENVNVIFEQEGLQGINPDDEPFIPIYASMAQNYSQTLSENVKWGYRRSFAKGGVYIGSGMLGYRRGDDGELEIVPNEAEVIRLIYKLYLDGYSEGSIAREMEKHGFRTAKGNTKWYHKTVDSILSNEKYMGDAISQKTYIQDIFSKKSVRNTGQLPQYYITDSHEGIISKEVFKRVQFERARRRSMAPVTGKTKTNAGRFAP